MLQIRKSADRGYFDHGWLKTHHTFSFGEYRDADHVRFRSLRVMNEDWVAPGNGFGTHPHRDMEIVTYVLSGALEHRDSIGNGQVLRPGEFQRMSAGTGIEHSEFNPSTDEPVHLYQIWLLPEQRGIQPSYEQKSFAPEQRHNRLHLVASRDGAEDSLQIHQDARIYLGTLDSAVINAPLAEDRYAWLQVLRGNLEVNGHLLAAGDGLAVSNERELCIKASQSTASEAEVMLFDLG